MSQVPTQRTSSIQDEDRHGSNRTDTFVSEDQEPETIEQFSDSPSANRSWSERLRQLSQIAENTIDRRGVAPEAEDALQAHLDALESIFTNASPELTSEASTPSRPTSEEPTVARFTDFNQMNDDDAPSIGPEHHHLGHAALLTQLTHLLGEITSLNEEVERRRNEARHIRERFEEKCRGLTRDVTELEEEVLELHSDIIEDAIDLECLQGTVKGLHEWTNRTKEEQERNRALRDFSAQYHRTRGSWMGRKSKGNRGDRDAEIDREKILDGIAAWMRGWRDLEVEFEVRSRARRMRRDKRQEELMRAAEKSVPARNEQGQSLEVEDTRLSH